MLRWYVPSPCVPQIDYSLRAEFAFYVNKNGWRTRPKWAIIWEGVPTAFGMSHAALSGNILTYSTAISLCHRVRAHIHRSPTCRDWCFSADPSISPHPMSIRRYTSFTSERSNTTKSSAHVWQSTTTAATTTTTANETTATKSTWLPTSSSRRSNETTADGFRTSRWTSRWSRRNATTSTDSICPKSNYLYIGRWACPVPQVPTSICTNRSTETSTRFRVFSLVSSHCKGVDVLVNCLKNCINIGIV